MSPAQTLKEMQKLAGCVTSLGRFISKLGECAPPFFKLMKKKGPFEWTPEADQAFQDLKRHLTSPPMMVAPRPLEPLVLYLAATPYSASAALVAVREERQAKDTSRQTAPPAGAARDPKDTAGAAATPTDDPAHPWASNCSTCPATATRKPTTLPREHPSGYPKSLASSSSGSSSHRQHHHFQCRRCLGRSSPNHLPREPRPTVRPRERAYSWRLSLTMGAGPRSSRNT